MRDLSPWLEGICLLPVSSHARPFVCDCVLIFSSYRDISHVGFGPTLMALFTLITSLKALSWWEVGGGNKKKALSLNTVTFWGLGIRVSAYDTIQPIRESYI